MTATPTALIAEDEPLLAAALHAELARAWPELVVAAVVGDGASAVREALRLRPDVLFLDIRMPGQSGLQAAAELAEDWPAQAAVQGPAHAAAQTAVQTTVPSAAPNAAQAAAPTPAHPPTQTATPIASQPGTPAPAAAQPFPALVFVTAYDQYAVQAFEAQAIDYLLKPVQPARLARTVARVQQALAARQTPPPEAVPESVLHQLKTMLRQVNIGDIAINNVATEKLTLIPASVGHSIHMVPMDEVLAFEAADKYLRVLTASREYLIRTPLKDLLPQLDDQQFWQIHRSVVVRASAIEAVTRDETGRQFLTLKSRPEKLPISRLYAQRFRAL